MNNIAEATLITHNRGEGTETLPVAEASYLETPEVAIASHVEPVRRFDFGNYKYLFKCFVSTKGCSVLLEELLSWMDKKSYVRPQECLNSCRESVVPEYSVIRLLKDSITPFDLLIKDWSNAVGVLDKFLWGRYERLLSTVSQLFKGRKVKNILKSYLESPPVTSADYKLCLRDFSVLCKDQSSKAEFYGCVKNFSGPHSRGSGSLLAMNNCDNDLKFYHEVIEGRKTDWLKKRDKSGDTPLLLAARVGAAKSVKYMLMILKDKPQIFLDTCMTTEKPAHSALFYASQTNTPQKARSHNYNQVLHAIVAYRGKHGLLCPADFSKTMERCGVFQEFGFTLTHFIGSTATPGLISNGQKNVRKLLEMGFSISQNDFDRLSEPDRQAVKKFRESVKCEIIEKLEKFTPGSNDHTITMKKIEKYQWIIDLRMNKQTKRKRDQRLFNLQKPTKTRRKIDQLLAGIDSTQTKQAVRRSARLAEQLPSDDSKSFR